MGVQRSSIFCSTIRKSDSDDSEIQMQTGSFIITFEDDNSVFMLVKKHLLVKWLQQIIKRGNFCVLRTWVERDNGVALQKIPKTYFPNI